MYSGLYTHEGAHDNTVGSIVRARTMILTFHLRKVVNKISCGKEMRIATLFPLALQ